jgi:hypothetical protein
MRRRRHHMGSFGRRHRRRHLRGFGFGFLSGPGFGDDLKDVAIGVGAGFGGLFLWRFVEAMLPTVAMKLAGGGIAGVIGGTLLSRISKPAGIGLGATMGAAAIAGAVQLAMDSAAPVSGIGAYPWTRRYGVHGVGAYPWSRRYGMHAVGQMDPYAIRMPLQGFGRTRVIEQEPRGYEINGLGAGYSYHSSAVRLSGLGQPKPQYYGWGLGRRGMPSRFFSNPLLATG